VVFDCEYRLTNIIPVPSSRESGNDTIVESVICATREARNVYRNTVKPYFGWVAVSLPCCRLDDEDEEEEHKEENL
jgi:hypothetical protein